MPQLAYSLTAAAGGAGMLYGNGSSQYDRDHAIAGAIIQPGQLIELVTVSGRQLAFPLKDATTGGSFAPKLLGVAEMIVSSAEQAYTTYAVPNIGGSSTFAGYPIGKVVPFLRRGLIWAQWDGNTGTALPAGMGTMQVIHSSTGAHQQGVVTTLAAQTTVGYEIDALPATVQFYDPTGVSGSYTDAFGNVIPIVVLSLNLPGHS